MLSSVELYNTGRRKLPTPPVTRWTLPPSYNKSKKQGCGGVGSVPRRHKTTINIVYINRIAQVELEENKPKHDHGSVALICVAACPPRRRRH